MIGTIFLWLSGFMFGAAFALHPLTRPVPRSDNGEKVIGLLVVATVFSIAAWFF